jgi:hypothetical protein
MRRIHQTNRRWLTAPILAMTWFGMSACPAEAQIAVIGSTVVERVALSGETYAGTIVVRNLTKQHQPVRIYQTDYLFYADGTSRYDVGGTAPRSNSRWIVPTQRSLVIAPLSDATVSYAVSVPKSDSLLGSFWSAIMVEAAPISAAMPPGERPQVAVGTVMRYAVQVATHIRATGSRKVTFAGAKVVAESNGDQVFELDVLNSGERAHRPKMWIEVYDHEGALRAKARQERGLLYPGTSLRQRFALGRIGAGTYRAVVFADSGDDAVFAAPFTLRF